jgi:thiamine kinase-like enzyme
MLELIKKQNNSIYTEISKPFENVQKIEKLLKQDGWDYQLSHNDIWEDNLLVNDNELYLIDWEYAGDTDIGYDISKLCVKSECEVDNLSEYLFNYFERYPTKEEINHLIGCTAVSYYYWTVWATYMIMQCYKYEQWKERYSKVFYKYYTEYINNKKEAELWNC